MKPPTQKLSSAAVAFVVLGWNNRDLLEECFQSVYDQTYTDWELILVDNGSSDDSVEYTKTQHPRVTVIETGANLGFAVGNNIGIRHALKNPNCRYIAFLNTDATLEPDWLEKLVAFADKHPRGAGFQAPTYDYYDHKVLDSCGILIDRQALATQIGYRQTNVKLETRRVFGVNAAAAIYSRAYLDTQPFGDDYLDHHLWMYLEDVDIATRAVMTGWENWLVAETKAYHMGSASSGKNPGFSLFLTYRNNWPVLVKNLPWAIIWRTFPGMWRAEFARLRAFTREGRFKLVWVMIKGRSLSVFKLPIFLYKRRILKKHWKIGKEALWNLMDIPPLPKLPPTNLPFGEDTVTFIVVAQNDVQTVADCLRAIQEQSYRNHRVTLVDNASNDGTSRAVSEMFPEVRILQQADNLGIANGFNVGLTEVLKQDNPDYVACVEASVVIGHTWLEQTVRTIRAHELAFTVGSTVTGLDKRVGSGYAYQPGTFPRPVHVTGNSALIAAPADGAYLVRSAMVGPVGMMDGEFFDGFGQVDWSLRAALMGFTSHSSGAAAKSHRVQTNEDAKQRWYQNHKNVCYLYLRTTPLKLLTKTLGTASRKALGAAGTGVQKGYVVSLLKIVIKLLMRTPRILLWRRRINMHRLLTSSEFEVLLSEQYDSKQ